MARTSDPNSATAQFFINTVDNAGLDYPNPDGNGYAVFGKVVAGMDVVKKIEGTPDHHARADGGRAAKADRDRIGHGGLEVIAKRLPLRWRARRASAQSNSHRSEHHHGRTAYEPRRHQARTGRGEGAEDGRELPQLREEGPLRQHGVPPRDRRLHDPGRRLRAGHEAEADRRADQQRSEQRPEERRRARSRWRARTIRIRRPRSSSST